MQFQTFLLFLWQAPNGVTGSAEATTEKSLSVLELLMKGGPIFYDTATNFVHSGRLYFYC